MKTAVSIAFAFVVASAPWSQPCASDDPKHQGQRLDLAAAYVLEGMFDQARPVLDSFPDTLKKLPADDDRSSSPKAATARRLALQWRLLNETLDPGKSDAFELLIDVLAGQQLGWDDRDPVSSVLWQKVFARYAKPEGHPVIGGYVLRRSSNYFGYVLDPKESHEPAERAAAAAQNDEVTREIARLEEGAPDAVGAPGRGVDRVSATIVRLLKAPRIVPFREVPLAPAFKPMGLTREQEESRSEELLKGVSV
jgi:hypothetical protein